MVDLLNRYKWIESSDELTIQPINYLTNIKNLLSFHGKHRKFKARLGISTTE
jgi:hypothetical protein